MSILEPALGFISASLVALIALGFGCMLLFFSGSAVMVVGQFLPFVRAPRVALASLGAAAGAAAGVAAWVDSPIPWTMGAGIAASLGEPIPRWTLPLEQAVCTAVVYSLVRTASLRRLSSALGVALLAAGALFVATFAVPALEPVTMIAIGLVALFLYVAMLGAWPLVLGGLVRHRLERPVEWFISLRYLVAKRRQTFISIITVICVTGVALGVAVITVVLSVMNGFSRVWEGKIIGARAHFVLHSRAGPYADYELVRDAVLGVRGVEGATPFLATDAILRADTGELHAVMLKGVDPETVGDATQLAADIESGSLDALAPAPGATAEAALPGVILGAQLADRLFLRAGDPIVLISPLGGAPTPLGPAPRMLRFRVAGTFRADFFQFDESFVYTDLASAQRFMKLGDVVSGIEVRTVDAYRSQAIADEVQRAIGLPFYARDWKQFFPGFFQALKMERVMMFVLLSFIMVVAGFIITATLIMMIMEKSRDIAILKAMGCDDDGVLRVFAIEGFLIGVAGLGLGLGMGLVITLNLDTIQSWVERAIGFDVLPANVYQLQHLPYDIVPFHVALISLIAMVLSVGATLLPSWQAARLDPAEALRYE